MIIKHFGRKNIQAQRGETPHQTPGKVGPERSDDKNNKIDFNALVDPLIKIIKRSQDNGVKLTSYSIMAIINLCNYGDNVKEIFLSKNGFQIIMQLFNSKDEEVLINTLKLVTTLIAQKQHQSS